MFIVALKTLTFKAKPRSTRAGRFGFCGVLEETLSSYWILAFAKTPDATCIAVYSPKFGFPHAETKFVLALHLRPTFLTEPDPEKKDEKLYNFLKLNDSAENQIIR